MNDSSGLQAVKFLEMSVPDAKLLFDRKAAGNGREQIFGVDGLRKVGCEPRSHAARDREWAGATGHRDIAAALELGLRTQQAD